MMLSLPPISELTLLAPSMLLLGIPLVGLLLTAVLRGSLRALSALLFGLSGALIILALAQPARVWSSSQSEITALFDASQSVSLEGKAELLSALRPFLDRPESTVRVIPFGRSASRKALVLKSSRDILQVIDSLADVSASVDSGDTNIGGAIQQIALSGTSSGVLLLSDGFETSGNAKQAARLAGSRGVKVYPLLRNDAAFRDRGLTITGLQAPLTVNAGDLAEIRGVVKNTDPQSSLSGVFELWSGQKKLFSQNIVVEAGQERVITVKSPALEGGLHRIRATMTQDRGPTQRAATTETHRWISAKARSKVLLLSGTAEDARVLRQLYALKGFVLEDLIADGSRDIPTSFADYTSVILNNAALRQLPSGFLPALQEYVKGGGGLILIGGDRSFGLGGYIDSPLEELSPLKFVPPKTAKKRLTNGIVLLVDKSRSMASEGKIEAAKDAALISINTVKDDDYISVIGFDSAPFVIIRLAKADSVRATAEQRLRNLTAAGRTDLLPALAAAKQSLVNSPTSRRHIIILSDGIVPESGAEYLAEINDLRNAGVTVSCVAVGSDADSAFMQTLAKRGGGAFYYTVDPRRLPEIFLQDIKVSTGERTMKESQDFPVGLGVDGVRSTSVNEFPALRGFVETLPKKGAQLELITRTEEDTFPILASWQFGAGRVIAYTSDANGRWSLPWLNWSAFPRFWTQILESAQNTSQPKASDVNFDFRYFVTRRELNFDLAIFDQKLASGSAPRVTAEVTVPGGEQRTVSFVPSKAGRFIAALDNARPGDYRLNMSYGGVKLPPVAVTIPGEAFGEIPGKGVDVANLSEIAHLSGGSLNPSPEELFVSPLETEEREVIFQPLLFAAFFLGILAIIFREIGPRLLVKLIKGLVPRPKTVLKYRNGRTTSRI